MTRRTGVTLVVAIAFVFSFLLVGCDAADDSLLEVGTSSGAVPQAMASEARTALPEGFPIEVPVISGEVIDGQTDDLDLGPWYYVLECASGRDVAASWYRQAYTGRSWQVVDESRGDTEHVLVLQKGAGAWSTVRISTSEQGCRIDCWTGIGVSMPPEALPPAKPPASEV